MLALRLPGDLLGQYMALWLGLAMDDLKLFLIEMLAKDFLAKSWRILRSEESKLAGVWTELLQSVLFHFSSLFAIWYLSFHMD